VGTIRNYTRIALVGRHARDQQRIDATRGALAKARRDLVNHTRVRLHLSEADPFSVAESE